VHADDQAVEGDVVGAVLGVVKVVRREEVDVLDAEGSRAA